MPPPTPDSSAGPVSLRDVIESDLPRFFEHQQDPEAAHMAAFRSREREAFMTHWGRILANEAVVKKTVLVDGQVAGNVVSFEQGGRTEVGYWLDKAYWGRGIATQALAQFLEQVGVRPLYAHVAKHNLGSLRVLEKCGFKICGENTAPGEAIEEFILELKGP